MGVFGMKNWIKTAGLYALVCAAALLSAMALSRVGSAVAVFSRETGTTVVVDAGHGGEDGGTLSCTGVRESGLNLEIALRVNDLFALLGQRTRMLRTQDVSLHDTEAATIAARKASDIRARVRLTEETPKAVLLSIHQNHFPESKYRGAQVFYAAADGSRALAERLQTALGTQLDPDNHRACKKAGEIYLLKHVSCPAVLVECGFLSNPAEEARCARRNIRRSLRQFCAAACWNFWRNPMKAAKTVFLCSNCGNETPRWQGRCPSCGQWNTLEEYTPPQAAAPSRSSLSNRTSAARGVGVQPKRLNEVTSGEELRFGTGLSELDRVLGGGAVRGSLVLVSGAPGIGKSTLLLQICAQICREQTIPTCLRRGEREPAQAPRRAPRRAVRRAVAAVRDESGRNSGRGRTYAARPSHR